MCLGAADVCACDMGSHGDTPRTDSMWHEMRGVLSFTEGLGYHPIVWTGALMVPPLCHARHILCNRCSTGGNNGHGGEVGGEKRLNGLPVRRQVFN